MHRYEVIEKVTSNREEKWKKMPAATLECPETQTDVCFKQYTTDD